jgi:membrane protein DedA with SNARE-associated domain
MAVEGPIVTYSAAVVASLGYLNVWLVIVISFLGGFLPDVFLYTLGRSGRTKTIERFAKKFGLSQNRLETLEINLKKHIKKTLFFSKLTPILPIPALILSGFIKVPLKKFLPTIFLLNLAGAVIFTLLGFYSGLAVITFSKFLKVTDLIIPFLIVIVIGVYFLIKKGITYLSKKERGVI